jgi:UDP-N-acetylglucosamine transferase subunit ALG13
VIFVTVGTQLPFDRLVDAVDRWAGAGPDRDVVAQTNATSLRPRHVEHHEHLSPGECRDLTMAADAIVAHAGMGTILTALELGKPLVIMPRSAALGEHRNEHQLATAQRFADLGRVRVAFDAEQLLPILDDLGSLRAQEPIRPFASERLIGALRRFIDEPARV